MSKFLADQWIEYVNRRGAQPDELARLRAENERLRAAIDLVLNSFETRTAKGFLYCTECRANYGSHKTHCVIGKLRAALAGKEQA